MFTLPAQLGRTSGHIAQAEVALRPVQAIAGGELQAAHCKLVAVLLFGRQTALQRLQLQRLGLALPLQLQGLHGHIRHHAHGLAGFDIQPGFDGAFALLQLPVLRP